MKGKCKKCGDTVEVTRLREYKTCKCGAIGLDYGDGYYYRVCGSPEDFDGEIEGAPNNLGIAKVEDPHKPEKINVILNKKPAKYERKVKGLYNLSEALYALQGEARDYPNRQLSIAITKVEEAIMWLSKGE